MTSPRPHDSCDSVDTAGLSFWDSNANSAPDGTYLGEVQVPERTSIHIFRGDTLWGIRRGDLDEQYVVRLHIGHPPQDQSRTP